MNTKKKLIESFLGNVEGWKSVLNSSPDLITILDTEFNVVWINKAMEMALGNSHASCLGLKCFEVVHCAESPIQDCPHAKMMQDCCEHSQEVIDENLGGRFLVTVSPIKDGSVIGSVHIARDISEHKKAEENVQRLADVVESSDDAIITKSFDGTIISWNKGAEQIYGYAACEIIGKPISILEPPKLSKETKRLINKIKDGEKVDHYETLRLKKDGSLINVSVTLSPVFDVFGELVAISTIARDITGRKTAEKQKQDLLERTQQFAEELEVSNEELQATTEELQVSNEELHATTEELQAANEELHITTDELQVSNEELRQQEEELLKINDSLRENEERFRALADNIPNMAWMASADGWIFWYNEQWYSYTGMTLDEMQGWGWQKVHHPDYKEQVTEEWSACIKEGKVYDNTFPLRGADGKYRWFLTRVTPIKDEMGNIHRWFGTNTDITQQKNAEEVILWNQKRNELLAEVSSRLLTSENPQDIIDDLCCKTMDFLECDVFFNYLVDEEKGCLYLNAYHGISKEEAHEIEWLNYGDAVRGCASFESCRIVAEDILETPDPQTDLVKGYGVQAYACYPLMVEGMNIGTLSFGASSRVKFTDEELDLMNAVADQIAIAMNRLISNRILKESEETAVQIKNEWEHTFEAVPDLIAILSPDYKVVRVNKAMADKFGLTPEKCTGMACYEVVHGTEEPPSFCPHKQLLEDGKEHTEEIYEDNLGGDFLVSASPLHDAEGKLQGSVHVARDINKRKKREKELYRLNKAYMALSNSSHTMNRAENELEYLEEVCKIIVEDCGHSMVWIGYAEDNKGKTVEPVAYAGFEEGYLETLNVTWADNERGRGPTGTAIRTGKPSACTNMHTDPEFGPWRENAVKRGYFSSLALPLIWKGNVLGALTIYSKEQNSFSVDEIKLLTKLGEDLAYGINALRLRIALKKSENALKKAHDNLEAQVKERTAELKEAYEGLKKSEKQLREQAELINITHDALIVRNMDGKILYWNKGAEKMYGWTQREALGKIVYELLQTEFPEPLGDIDSDISIKNRWNGELVRTKRDGTDIIVSSRWVLKRDNNGNPNSILMTDTDITDRKKVEEELRVVSRYNRNLIEASLDPFVTIGPDGKITDVNKATELITGCSRDELIGTDFSDYFTEPEKARDGYKQVFKDRWIVDYPLEIKHRNGHVTPVLYNASVYEDESDNVIGVFAAARDITELKRAEAEKQNLLEQAQQFAEELEVSNEELQATTGELQTANEELKFANKYNRSLIEASLDPLVTIGPDGKITDVNKATELITGCSRDELIGTDFSDYFTEPEKARAVYQEVFREGMVIDYPLGIKHKKGHVTPVLYNASVYKDEFGNVIGVFAAARDITERKQAEKMLKLKLEELARSNAELEQFAYVSSHDLQEPLRMIGSYLQLLQRRYHGKLDDKADKYIDFAVDGASRMQNLINDLLEFSRVTTRANEFKSTDCELVLNQVLSNLEVSITESKAVILHDHLPSIMADSTQLAQVFQNLISNAIKFHSEKAPEITISAQEKSDHWLFSVADNGIGIDPKHSERIFEVFKRLHKRRDYPGTGIGLSICKKIIERHDGHIWVESEPGKGSIFYFTLPVNPIKSSNQ